MSINSISVKKLVTSYFVCIILFALVYYFSPKGFLNQELSFINAIYFSVVTITTLGYGDILPKSDAIQLVISVQALLGLVILGLLINAAWSSYVERIEQKTEQRLIKQTQLINDRKLKAYSNAIAWVFNNMRHSFFEVTTPVKEREKKPLELNENYNEKDLIGMFDISLKYKNGYCTSIEAYYDNEDTLVSELKFILANFDLDHYPVLQKSIVGYLGAYFSDQSKGTLLLYSKNCPNGQEIRTIRELLKNHKDGDQFDNESFDSILSPILIFSLSINHKYKLMTDIKDTLQSIGAKVT